MGLSFTEFKNYVQQREVSDYRLCAKVLNKLNQLYDEKTFKFFYPKNIFNDKPTELIIFLQNGYLLVAINDNSITLEQNNCKVVKKVLKSPALNEFEDLTITFDNGNVLVFHNYEDSNSNWFEEYSIAITEAYKIL